MDKSRFEIKEKFEQIANEYDKQRKKLIPCFDDFYSIPVSLACADNDVPCILDIGAGTGLLSSLILRKYPQAQLTLIDISDQMIDVAKSRFKDNPNIKYIVDDYTKHIYDQSFDLVLSSLSIHHLTDPEKETLYQSVFKLLKAQGVFINADQVLGHTPYLESLYKEDWKTKVENSQLSQYEIECAYERTKLDKMSTLNEQIKWLKNAGFGEVDCVYKYFNFVVLYARKV